MGNLAGFKPDEVERMESNFELIPPGSYKAAITDAPLTDTKAGTGKYLKLTLQILEGKYQNRLIWENLNLINPNKTAENIGKSALADICDAVGIKEPNDSSELCHKPLVIVVGQKKRSDTGEMQNVIRGYKSIDAFEPEPVDEQKAPW